MKRIIFTVVASTMLLVAGCGKKAGTSQAEDSGPVIRRGGVATVVITGNDQMRFDITAFTVKSGEKVRIVFENIGTQPIATMGHDLVILETGVDYKTFDAKIAPAGGSLDNGYLPKSVQDEVLEHTKLLGPGEKDSISFTAPAPGKYEYLCTFPGHFVFMNGVMTVE
jgi:azurin